LLFTVGMGAGSQRPLLILSPILAETLARGGLDKPALKRRLFAARPDPRPRKLERYIGEWTNLVPRQPTLHSLGQRARPDSRPVFAAVGGNPKAAVPLGCVPAEDLEVR